MLINRRKDKFHKMETYTAMKMNQLHTSIWMNLAKIMLNEKHQT